MQIGPRDALIVVDVQNDFCPEGALPVPEGDKVVPIINSLIPRFGTVFYTRDWHPQDHCSFDDEPTYTDMHWPAHCVADSPGAEFHGDLIVPLDAPVVSKAVDPEHEAYSGFQETDLADQLRARQIERIFVCGLATDYCVKFTAMDGLKEGFEVVLVENACRGIDNPPGSLGDAVDEMKRAGVQMCWSGDLS